MPNVALRGVPDHVHRRIKDAARANHRSVNGEILARLVASVAAEPPAPPISATAEPLSANALRDQAPERDAAGGAPPRIDANPGSGKTAPIPNPYEPISEEELLERIRKLREEVDARGGIDASPENIEALIQEGRRR